MRKILSDKKTQEIAIETAFRIITEPKKPPATTAEIPQYIADNMAAATGLAAADINDILDKVAAETKAADNIEVSRTTVIQETLLAAMRRQREADKAAPVVTESLELSTPPVDKPKNVSAFALDLAGRTKWSPNTVQVWLNYFDELHFDYVGLGVQNLAVLLPYMIQTARTVDQNNASRPLIERAALIRAALIKNTSDALNRSTNAGNRAQRRRKK